MIEYDGSSIIFSNSVLRNIWSKISNKFIAQLDFLLEETKWTKDQIQDIILLGEWSHFPYLKENISVYFDGKDLWSSFDLQNAVVFGWAAQGSIISQADNSKLKDILILDIWAYSIGIETAGGWMKTLINKNTTIPWRKSQIFTTYSDNNGAVCVFVFEGENK